MNQAQRVINRLKTPISAQQHDRGDVPGWVLIVLMTAGLVVTIWALAGPALSDVFTDAIARVTSQ